MIENISVFTNMVLAIAVIVFVYISKGANWPIVGWHLFVICGLCAFTYLSYKIIISLWNASEKGCIRRR